MRAQPLQHQGTNTKIYSTRGVGSQHGSEKLWILTQKGTHLDPSFAVCTLCCMPADGLHLHDGSSPARHRKMIGYTGGYSI